MVLYVLIKTGGSRSVYLRIYVFIYLSIYLGVKQENFGEWWKKDIKVKDKKH